MGLHHLHLWGMGLQWRHLGCGLLQQLRQLLLLWQPLWLRLLRQPLWLRLLWQPLWLRQPLLLWQVGIRLSLLPL